MENIELKKYPMCYYYDEIIESEDFDFDHFLIDEKLCKNILIYNIS